MKWSIHCITISLSITTFALNPSSLSPSAIIVQGVSTVEQVLLFPRTFDIGHNVVRSYISEGWVSRGYTTKWKSAWEMKTKITLNCSKCYPSMRQATIASLESQISSQIGFPLTKTFPSLGEFPPWSSMPGLLWAFPTNL